MRQVSVTGVCRVLFTYRDQIPEEVSADLLNILFTKLAWDQSSIDVRVAVIQVGFRGIVRVFDAVECQCLERVSRFRHQLFELQVCHLSVRKLSAFTYSLLSILYIYRIYIFV